MSGHKKVAIVTGGGTGIGRHTVLALLREGYSVVVAGRRLEPLQATLRESGDLAAQALVVQADVSNPDSVKALFAKALDAFGRLDLLFNNAGTGAPPVSLEALTLEQWQSVVDVNLTGAFLCTREAMRIMKNQNPMGRAYHQQRLHIGPNSASKLRALYGHQARYDGSDQVHGFGWTQVRHRMWSDRRGERRYSNGRQNAGGY